MSFRSLKKRTAMVAGLLAGSMLMLGAAASAADYSFTGNFTQDDDVQLFNFTVEVDSNVVLRSWSYAGGINAAGDVIARGGFDPILALFDGSGLFIDQNDDDEDYVVNADPMTGEAWDVYLSLTLAAGDYTVAVMQYDNFAIGPYLSDGFERTGEGNFTPPIARDCHANQFCDVSGVFGYNERDSHWVFDILNVGEAEVIPPDTGGPTPTVPEPASWALLISGFGLVGTALRRRQRELAATR